MSIFSLSYLSETDFKVWSLVNLWIWHIVICWAVVSSVCGGWSCKESSFHLCVSSEGEKLQYSVQGSVDASVCAVMWSSHASVLRKYVTFHLQDAGRCKAAVSLPSSLREEDRLPLPSYKPATWRSCYYSLLPHMDGGIWDWKLQNGGWVMTLVRLNEFYLIYLEKIWLVLCWRLFCMCCNLCH